MANQMSYNDKSLATDGELDSFRFREARTLSPFGVDKRGKLVFGWDRHEWHYAGILLAG